MWQPATLIEWTAEEGEKTEQEGAGEAIGSRRLTWNDHILPVAPPLSSIDRSVPGRLLQ